MGCRGPRHGVEGLVGVQKVVWLRFYWLRVQEGLDGVSGRVQGLGWGTVGRVGTLGSQLGCRGTRQGCGGFGWGASGLVRVQGHWLGCRETWWDPEGADRVQQAWLGCRRVRQGSRGLTGMQMVWVGGQGGCLRFRGLRQSTGGAAGSFWGSGVPGRVQRDCLECRGAFWPAVGLAKGRGINRRARQDAEGIVGVQRTWLGAAWSDLGSGGAGRVQRLRQSAEALLVVWGCREPGWDPGFPEWALLGAAPRHCGAGQV